MRAARRGRARVEQTPSPGALEWLVPRHSSSEAISLSVSALAVGVSGLNRVDKFGMVVFLYQPLPAHVKCHQRNLPKQLIVCPHCPGSVCCCGKTSDHDQLPQLPVSPSCPRFFQSLHSSSGLQRHILPDPSRRLLVLPQSPDQGRAVTWADPLLTHRTVTALDKSSSYFELTCRRVSLSPSLPKGGSELGTLLMLKKYLTSLWMVTTHIL